MSKLTQEYQNLLHAGKCPILCRESLFDLELVEGIRVEALKLCENGVLQTAAMGSSGKEWENSYLRGDKTCWITPELCKLYDLGNMKTLIGHVMKSNKETRNIIGNSKYFTDVSVQLALYPPGGSYTKHLDVRTKDYNILHRQITLVLYLNHEYDGGQLRCYLPTPQASNSGEYIDVEPKLGNVALFCSERIEHEVLPSRTDRLALTVWISGMESIKYTTGFTNITTSLLKDFSAYGNRISMRAPCDSSSDTKSGEHKERVSSSTIFVSVASYRDAECQRTLYDLFQKADDPKRLFVGVVLQLYESDSWEYFGVPSPFTEGKECKDEIIPDIFRPVTPDMVLAYNRFLHHNVRVLRMDARQARGPCWARNIARSLWSGEDFYLQVDAHMRFRRGWDVYLVDLHATCRDTCNSAEPVISTYPPNYEVSQNGWDMPTDIRPTVLVPMSFDSDGMLRQKSRVLRRIETLPIKHYLWAAGFSFSAAKVMVAITPYNPCYQDLFFGEEISMAARMYTNNIDVFAPPETVVYHLWSRKARPPELASSQEERDEKARRREASLSSVRKLLGMESEKYDGVSPCSYGDMQLLSVDIPFGLGGNRSLRSFEDKLRVKFRDRLVLECADIGDLEEKDFANDYQDVMDLIAVAKDGEEDDDTSNNCDSESKANQMEICSIKDNTSNDNIKVLSLVSSFLTR